MLIAVAMNSDTNTIDRGEDENVNAKHFAGDPQYPIGSAHCPATTAALAPDRHRPASGAHPHRRGDRRRRSRSRAHGTDTFTPDGTGSTNNRDHQPADRGTNVDE